MPRREGCLDRDAIASLVGLKATDTIGFYATDKVSFYGVTPVAQAAIAAAGTNTTTTQALANDLRTKLIDLGLVSA